MKQTKLFLFVLMLLASVAASADDDTFEDNKGGIYAVMTENTAELVDGSKVEGDYVIPETVEINSDKYTVTSIGYSAFNNNTALTSVTIPNSVTSISYNAFSYCSSLTSIKVESGNPNYDSRNDCNAIIETSSNTLLIGCRNTIIPNSVTSIGVDAFFECSELTSVTIPNSVTSIGDYAFAGCSLTSLTIPTSVISIGIHTFSDCSITSLTIPNSLTSIGDFAFSGCSDLTSIKVESGNPNYDSRNDCNAIIETSSNTLLIGCRNTIIPNSVTSIGDYAFFYCYELTSLTIPNSVTSIGYFAFRRCDRLTSVVIPNSVTSIDDDAFRFCPGLTSLTIPNSVIFIGNNAFSGCGKLEKVFSYIEKPFKIEQNVFCSYNYMVKTYVPSEATLYIPDGTLEEYKNMGWTEQFAKIVEYESGALFNESGTTYQAQSENTVAVMGSGVVEAEYVIPETVTHDGVDYTVTAIENEAFKDNAALTAVTIPETVVAIGNGAFAGCIGLTAIYAYAAEPANLATATTRAEAASSVFEGVDKETCVLYVPKGCVEKYRAAEGWGEFIHIEEMEGTGISNLTIIDRKAFDVYDMSGRKVRTVARSLNGLPRGIYIINGKKVIK